MDGLNRAWAASGRPTAGMRIGIKSGEAIAGNVGSHDRLKYTVVGDVANTAARLEGFAGVEHNFEAEPVRVLISAETKELIGDGQFDVEYIGAHPLKGKQALVEIYKLRVSGQMEAER